MSKLFSWIGNLVAIACLMEIAHNPKQVLRDIQQGPAPHLAQFDDGLAHAIQKSVQLKSLDAMGHAAKRKPGLR